jgi:hypothetical protein
MGAAPERVGSKARDEKRTESKEEVGGIIHPAELECGAGELP